MSDSFLPHGLKTTGFLCPWDFAGKKTGVGCHFLLQGIFPTQGSKLRLLHWQVGSLPLCLLRHPGSPVRVANVSNQCRDATFWAMAHVGTGIECSCPRTKLSQVMHFQMTEQSLRKFAKLKGAIIPLYNAFLTEITQICV